MDMTLAEQLVWAAVYARERGNNDRGPTEMEELYLARCCIVASAAVVELRDLFKRTTRNQGLKALMNKTGFDHLRQMVYKVED